MILKTAREMSRLLVLFLSSCPAKKNSPHFTIHCPITRQEKDLLRQMIDVFNTIERGDIVMSHDK